MINLSWDKQVSENTGLLPLYESELAEIKINSPPSIDISYHIPV